MIDRIVRETLAEVEKRRCSPESTYRLQFHSEFTFLDAEKIVPYLQSLGITHCYASPYLKARSGSKHGYDITDHRVLNPEIGSREDYDAFVTALHKAGLGQILDTVPNHMGVHASENPWWNDVLENGPASPYARYFDIAWYASPRKELHGKLLLPILGDLYGKVLESQQIKLSFEGGVFSLDYYDNHLPVAPGSYALVLEQCVEPLKERLGAEALPFVEFQSILTAVRNLPPEDETDPERLAERQREKEVVKRRLAKLCEDSAEVCDAIAAAVTRFNGTPGDKRSFDLLDGLLNAQAYRLAFWRVASDEINYRRFFDINNLAALSMERPEVFQATHELVFELITSGAVNGLRIDHPDGLYDPRQYLWRLQERYLLELAKLVAARDQKDAECENVESELTRAFDDYLKSVHPPGLRWPLYVVVEKILAVDEALPEDWATEGTSGYDFLNQLNGLFVDTSAERIFTRQYHAWIENDVPFTDLVYDKKALIMSIALSSELNMLGHQLDGLAQRERWSRDFTLHALRQGLRAVIAAFPVYRSYIAEEGPSEMDRRQVQRAVRVAKLKNRTLNPALFDFIRDVLLLKVPRPELGNGDDQAEQRHFAGKFQQVTAPVMAKGLEDTAFYIFNRLVSLNEVGGDPGRFGMHPGALHRAWQARQARWPYALSAASTHDTKRSEDVRARINVLSEMPEDWLQALSRWHELNNQHRVTIEEDFVAPDNNEETLLYQTLVGAWPLEPMDDQARGIFTKRIQEYMIKALHEAKVHTSWINPDPAYDEAVPKFIAQILDPKASPEFLGDFESFQKQVAHFGLLNALGQTLLRATAPGAVDTYQGTEIWDFSLVDPDNRRPVDYTGRAEMLRDLDARVKAAGPKLAHLAAEFARKKEDGLIKLYVLSSALRFRREHPGLLTAGEYIPLEVSGPQEAHVFAFARRHENDVALVVVPRLLFKLLGGETRLPFGGDVWADTRITLPREMSRASWRNLFTGQAVRPREGTGDSSLALAQILLEFPVALLTMS